MASKTMLYVQSEFASDLRPRTSIDTHHQIIVSQGDRPRADKIYHVPLDASVVFYDEISKGSKPGNDFSAIVALREVVSEAVASAVQ